jgi:hypothetical protein
MNTKLPIYTVGKNNMSLPSGFLKKAEKSAAIYQLERLVGWEMSRFPFSNDRSTLRHDGHAARQPP